jgi:quinohemoprotein ethanol dehydrogenase
MNVYAAETGERLTQIALGSHILAAPMTYEIGGVQYLAVMAGYGGGPISSPIPKASAAFKYGNEGRIIVLKLNGGPVPLPPVVTDAPFPKPPTLTASDAEVRQGEILYFRHCSRCHVFGRGVLPDLRRMSPATHGIFNEIVLRGAYRSKGMARFDDILDETTAGAIHEYLISEAGREYENAAHQ